MNRNIDTLLSLGEIGTLYQYLYLSKENTIEIKLPLATIEIYADDNFNLWSKNHNFPQLDPLQYNQLHPSHLACVIDQLKEAKPKMDGCDFKSRWDEILHTVAISLSLHKLNNQL